MHFSFSKFFKKKHPAVAVPEPEAFLKSCRSIVHLGANTGQERDFYHGLGLEVLWIEALPTVFAQLQVNIAPFHRQQAVHALIADVAGQKRALHISNNEGLSSSLFDLADHKKLWPEVAYSGEVELITSTLDQLLAAHWKFPTPADALIMDIQGAELLALQGATRLLRDVRYIKAEASDFESYAGACTLQSLNIFLKPLGFDLKSHERFAGKEGVGTYYDALWAKTPNPAEHTADHRASSLAQRTGPSAKRS
jgi:FkbM family methyltransferase